MKTFAPASIEEIRTSANLFGPKTQNLVALIDLGLPVPPFLGISTAVTAELAHTPVDLRAHVVETLVRAILQLLPASRYAVRSSALGEDSATSSQAGQFCTIFTAPDNLGAALFGVIDDANQKLGGRADQFSVIVQEAKVATWSGTAFTRDPSGGRELVMEYHRGVGEQVVGGQVVPDRLAWYRTQQVPSSPLPSISDALNTCLRIEQRFGCPQDIEWCIADGQWWWLQSRPITTLSPNQARLVQYLDENLPRQPFTFEKTEIAEIAPRPTPITWSLLQKIYGDGGPVQRVYQRFGIAYQARPFLRLVGNELFVDRQAEVETLLPAYDYNHRLRRPVMRRWRGLGMAWRNIARLGRVRDNQQRLTDQVLVALQAPSAPTFAAMVENFLTTYEVVFTINLCAEAEIQRIKRRYPADQVHQLLAVSAGSPPVDTASWRGNGLGLEDESRFTAQSTPPGVVSLPQPPDIIMAQGWITLREQGRWLTVKLVNELRTAAQAVAGKSEDALFLTIDELRAQPAPAATVSQRRHEYEEWSGVSLPTIFSSEPPHAGKTFGVSAGIGTGRGVWADDLPATGEQPVVLLTDILAPSLAPTLDGVAAIVAGRGGTLSHLAIIARERHIPVVIMPDLRQHPELRHQQLTVDGTTGTVTVTS